jgi:hypothetical protein
VSTKTDDQREAQRAYDKAYYVANREAKLAREKARYEANREAALARQKVYYEANREAELGYAKAYRKANPDKVNAHEAKRRAAKLQRTPSWADPKAIEAVYELREFCDRVAGPAHVDHELPLQGELVSGLHVHFNLQVLPGSENVSKHNRFDPMTYEHRLP